MTIAFGDFEKVDMRTGVIIGVEDFPRARQHSYRVEVDFGREIGVKRSSAQVTSYPKEELVGMQVVAVVNFPPKNIAGFQSEVLLLGVPGEDGNISLLTPSRPARVGAQVY